MFSHTVHLFSKFKENNTRRRLENGFWAGPNHVKQSRSKLYIYMYCSIAFLSLRPIVNYISILFLLNMTVLPVVATESLAIETERN